MPSKTAVLRAGSRELDRFRAEVNLTVRRTAFFLEGRMKQLAPVDTGFLRNSITTQQLAEATWSVTVGAEYGFWVNYGTRKMRAQPFFEPAIEAARAFYEDQINRIIL